MVNPRPTSTFEPMRHPLVIPLLVLGILLSAGSSLLPAKSESPAKPRLLVLTDIGQDPDDTQSLIRLLLYTDIVDIVGLVATADNNYAHEAAEVRPDILHDLIQAYAEVYPNLVRHSPQMTPPAALSATIFAGSNVAGRDVPAESAIGEDMDTPGSQHIYNEILRPDAGILNIAVWGGAVDLAQALYRIKQEGKTGRLDHLRVYFIGHQDSTNLWIMQHIPDLLLIHARHPGGASLKSVYRGMFVGGDLSTLSREWIHEHIHGHGPLGDLYPTKTWTGGEENNPHGAIKEGDTPSFFYFLPLGLQDPAFPDYGGWGGRFQKSGKLWTDAQDTVGEITSGRATVFRWRNAFQADFQARLDWCILSPEEANHPPRIHNKGQPASGPIEVWVKAGESMHLNAWEVEDPDGDALILRWWKYEEPSTFTGAVPIADPSSPHPTVTIPKEARGHSIHLILEVTDTGEPALTSYQRVILRVL